MNTHTLTMNLEKKYLLFPIFNGVDMTHIDVSIEDKNVREFDIELATDISKVSFWSFLDITDFHGQSATIQLRGATKTGVNLIRQSEEIPEVDVPYRESLRPQFHFSQLVGWNNDPNGLVYYDGEWHLYFQHNPYGWKWGNMHWGHAVSNDLVHWHQKPIAIYNKRRGDWAFSGGAVVDENNTGGWQTGQEKVIVASWTSTGRGECISYSNDRGQTFTEYEENPVIKHQGRDPKIIWYAKKKQWVMAVYTETSSDTEEKELVRSIAFYTSNDLKRWSFQSRLDGYYECPEIFEIPVDESEDETRWVLFAADGQYSIGNFDGQKFIPEHDTKQRVHYGQYYASQTFSNSPDGRRIQIGWAQIEMEGMPFNQTFSFPHTLTLRKTDDGLRLFAEPIQEIEILHQTQQSVENVDLTDKQIAKLKVKGELFDIRANFILEGAKSIGLDIGGERITYDVSKGLLNDVPLEPENNQIALQVLVDRPMLETIGNRGRVFITSSRRILGIVDKISAFAEGGSAKLVSLEVNQLKSIW